MMENDVLGEKPICPKGLSLTAGLSVCMADENSCGNRGDRKAEFSYFSYFNSINDHLKIKK